MSKPNRTIAGYNTNYLISRVFPGSLFLVTASFLITSLSENINMYEIIYEVISSPGPILVSVIISFVFGSIIHRIYIYLYIPPSRIRKFYYKKYNNPEYLTGRSVVLKIISKIVINISIQIYFVIYKLDNILTPKLISKYSFLRIPIFLVYKLPNAIAFILPYAHFSNEYDNRLEKTILSIEKKFGVDKNPKKLYNSIMSVLNGRETKQLNEMRNSLELIYSVYLFSMFLIPYSIFNIISYGPRSNAPVEAFIIVLLSWIILSYFAILVRRYAERSYVERVFDEYNAVMEMEDQD